MGFWDWLFGRLKAKRNLKTIPKQLFIEAVKSALYDVGAREYSANHLQATHLDLILHPDNWDIQPRNEILIGAISKLDKAIASSATDRDRIESALMDISLDAMKEAEQIINRGMGGLITIDPGFRCSLSDQTREKLSELLMKK